MAVDILTVNHFRNICSSSIGFHPDLNFVIGDNGSGKSSLLEALFYLGHGKSFRTSRSENLVQVNQQSFIISVNTINRCRIGIERNINNVSKLKIDGLFVDKLSTVVQHIAVQIVTPESFKLFFGGPRERRRFFDLGLFHVKPDFQRLWKEFNTVHKQRNACLKQVRKQQIDFWTTKFVLLSEHISTLRYQYVQELTAELDFWLAILLPNIDSNIVINYFKGWGQQNSLSDILAEQHEREYLKGYSLYGCHKYDVKFSVEKRNIDQVLSRGQQKLFLLALTFAQAKLIQQVNRVKPIILIDDIGAELDSNSRIAFSAAYKALDSQVLITAIDKLALEPIVPADNNYKMFHVEHGQISEIGK